MEEKDLMGQTPETPEDVNAPIVDGEVKSAEDDLGFVEPEDKKAPKAEEPKPKKKLKKWQIALICVAGLILLAGIAVGLVFLIGGILAHKVPVVEGDFHNKPPVIEGETTYTNEELDLIEAAMKKDASDETVKKAIALIYNKANENKIKNTAQAITILQGQGSAALQKLGVKGSMAVRGVKVQANDEFYYQKAAAIVECDPVNLQYIVEDMLPQQERVYSNGKDDFRMTGTLKAGEAKILLSEKNPMTTTVPFIPVGIPGKKKIQSVSSYKDFMEKGFYLEDPREITNFKVTEDTIVLNELEEGEERIEKVKTEDGDVYYICRFSLLIQGEGHDECVKNAREYLRKSADSDDLEYKKFDICFEVWENGFFKMMHDEEIWEGTASGQKTTSTTWYESITYYNLDAEVFTADDVKKYEGDDWAKKIIDYYKSELDNAPAK